MALVQSWIIPRNGDTGASDTLGTADGNTATTTGNDLLVHLVVRTSSAVSATVTDTSSNTWALVAEKVGGNPYQAVFRAAAASSASSVTVSWFDIGGAPISAPYILFLHEFDPAGALVDSAVTIIPSANGGPGSGVTATATGQLHYAGCGVNNSSRVWTITASGVSAGAAEIEGVQDGQATNRTGYVYTSGAGAGAIGWDRTGGPSATTLNIIEALFDAPGGGPSSSEGTISGSVSWAGSVTGDAPTVGANTGTASGAIAWAGSATGERSPVGSTTGGIAWAGALVGKRVAIGGSSGQIVWDGGGVGHRKPVGTTSGTVGWTGTATGSTPDVGSSAGSIAGTVTWAGTLTGTRHPKAAAAGAVQWAATATGRRQPEGTLAGTVGWSGTVAGQSPAPGVKAGGILGGVGWTATATGKRDPLGVVGGSIAWAGSATGRTVRTGTAAGTVGWIGSVVGRGSGYRDITITFGAPTPARTIATTGPTPARILTLSGPRRTRP